MRWSGRDVRGGETRKTNMDRAVWFGLAALLLAALGVLVLRPQATAYLPSPRPIFGSQPYATLLCQFSGTGPADSEQQPSVSYYDRLMLGGPNSVDDYYRQVSYGAINLVGSKAFGWFQMEKPASAYDRPNLGRADLDGLARDCTAAADKAAGKSLYFPNFVGINLVFDQCVERPRGGAMDLTLDGRTQSYRLTWLCPGYASSQQIFAHEIGHSFGLTHSEDSQGAEYGNYWDLMSNAAYCAATTDVGTLAQDPIAYDKDVLGWIRAAEKYTVRQAGVATIQLDDLENRLPSSPGFLLAEIPLPGGRFYTVEARGRMGYDAALPSAAVLIHEIDPKRDNRAKLVQDQPAIGDGALLSGTGGWPVGSVFMDRENNVGVSVDRAVDHGFVVTIYTDELPWPLPTGKLAASPNGTTELQWQPASGTRQYEVQISRAAAEGASDWGATFVSDKASLDLPLGAGQYRWQVRVLPNGPWSPPQVILADRSPAWGSAQQVAELDGRLRVAPTISAQAGGAVAIAWARDDQRRKVSVTRAALQGNSWDVQDLFNLPPASRRGLALSFTPAGDLKVAWPAASVQGGLAMSSPAVALDAGGKAHTIWASSGLGERGIFSAVIDAHAPSAGPLATAGPAVQPVRVADDAPGAQKYSPALALDGNGNAQAVWIDTRDGHSAIYGAEQRVGGSWGPSQRLSGADKVVYGSPTIAADTGGHVYAVWQGGLSCSGPFSLTELSFAERPAGGEWQPAITLTLPTAGTQVVDPVVAANDAGEVYVAWGEIKDGAYRLYSAYRGLAGRWESRRVVGEGRTDGTSIRLSLAVTPRGEAYLTWADTQATRTSVRFVATH
jgi:hypothetical protein